MLTSLWNTALVNPILNILVALYQITGNLGIAIIVLTLLIRTVLIPIVVPSMRNMKKQKDLQPEIDKIRKKHKDKKKQAEAQMALFKEHGLNPASGCISQIPMLVVLIALYSVIRKLSMAENIMDINALLYFDSLKIAASGLDTHFLYMDLSQPDQFYILAVLAGIGQFFSSKLSMGFNKTGEDLAKKTPDKKDDVAYNVQKQMLYMMPIMTVVISLSLPSGAVLYILTTTIFSLVQTKYIFGKQSE